MTNFENQFKQNNNLYKSKFLEKLTDNNKNSFSEKIGQQVILEDNSFSSKVLNKAYQENLRGITRAAYGQCSHGSFSKC